MLDIQESERKWCKENGINKIYTNYIEREVIVWIYH